MSDQPSDSWTLTDILAIWGATAATVALAWNIFRDRGDKAKLQVTACIGYLPADEVACVTMSMTNTGKRALTVVSWGGQFTKSQPKRYFHVIHDIRLGGSELPKKLDCGEQANLITTNLDEIAIPTLDKMYVSDSTGKKWYISKRDRNDLR